MQKIKIKIDWEKAKTPTPFHPIPLDTQMYIKELESRFEQIVEQLENHKNCYEKVIGQVIVDNYDINLERVDLMNCAIDIVRKGWCRKCRMI